MSFLFFYPRMRPFDDNGAPIPGCYVKFFETLTTTPTPVYDAAGAELGVKITANAAGIFPALYGDPSIVYRMQLYGTESTPGADDGVLISDDDPIHPHVAFPEGTIMMFDGTAVDRDARFPPALWELCDGDNGTKDTRDCVPLGVSNTKPISGAGSTGGTGGGNTGDAGAHDHGAVTGGHSLTTAELATHAHTGGSATCSSDDNSQLESDHWLCISGEQSLGSVALPTFTTGNAGSGTAHTHSVTAAPDHHHSFVATPPYFTVWFLKRKP